MSLTRIQKHALRDLHAPTWWTTAAYLLYLVLFFALVGLSCLALYREWYAVLALSVCAEAFVMHAFLIAFHEGSHDGMCPHKPLNEAMVRLVGGFSFMSITLYRAVHQWHHRYLGTPRDEEFWPFSDPGTSRGLRRAMAFTELNLGLLHTPLLFLRAWVRPGARLKLSRRDRWMARLELAFPVLMWSAVAAGTLWTGTFGYFLVGYLVPAFLAGNVQSWRKYVEHIGLTGSTWETLTRAIRPADAAGRALSVSLLHEPYHDLHHRYPKIPQRRLPDTAAVDPPAEGRPVFSSYRAAVWDLCRGLGDPKFGPGWVQK